MTQTKPVISSLVGQSFFSTTVKSPEKNKIRYINVLEG